MILTLDAILDTPAAGPLRLALAKLLDRGEPVRVDGDAVERVGLACLQVLAAGEAAAAAGGVDFRITGASPALVEMTALAGLGSLATV